MKKRKVLPAILLWNKDIKKSMAYLKTVGGSSILPLRYVGGEGVSHILVKAHPESGRAYETVIAINSVEGGKDAVSQVIGEPKFDTDSFPSINTPKKVFVLPEVKQQKKTKEKDEGNLINTNEIDGQDAVVKIDVVAKTEEVVNSSAEVPVAEHVAVVKRGRGRPRIHQPKVIDPNAPKRPRGRPRKNCGNAEDVKLPSLS